MLKILETSRLYFRAFTPQDLDIYYQIRGNNEVMKYIPGGARTIEDTQQDLLDEIEHQQKYGFSKWACFLEETNEFIGRAGFSMLDSKEVEVGYGFLPEYWGNSYATETLSALLNYSKININTSKILGFTHPDNMVSKKVLEKSGMKFFKQELADNFLCDFYSL
jgi:RimJ/RimL family protein N-acetyltransferase